MRSMFNCVFSLEVSLLLSNKAKESLWIPEKSNYVKAKKQQMARLTPVHEYSERSFICPKLQTKAMALDTQCRI